MKEDIKILENSIKAKIFFNDKYYDALENLIKGYRELEGKLNELNTYILINGIDERLKTATQIQLENQSQYLHQKQVEKLKVRIEELKGDSIPISKIKEKIEELKKIEYSSVELAKIDETWESRILYEARKQYDYEIAQFTIKILQELLEEEE